MRLYEFDKTQSTLVGLLAHLKRKAEGKESAKVRTSSFLKMLRNMGVSMDSLALDNLKNDNDAIAKLISNVDSEYVELNLTGEEPEPEFDDLSMGDEMGGEEDMDSFGDEMGMDDEMAGPTTDEFEQPEMGGGAPAAQSPQQKVQNMAKSALSRRT